MKVICVLAGGGVRLVSNDQPGCRRRVPSLVLRMWLSWTIYPSTRRALASVACETRAQRGSRHANGERQRPVSGRAASQHRARDEKRNERSE